MWGKAKGGKNMIKQGEKTGSIMEWASMGDTEFLFRYMKDADQEEMQKFLEMIPEFLEEDEC